ncbi:MAG: hypothetical protein ACRBK7_27130 [Acidimicrobiales bacterium]
MAEPIPSRKPKPKPTQAGKVGRMVAAGGAVGVSLAMVGAMSAAASQSEATEGTSPSAASPNTEAQPVVRRVVVVPQTTPQPEQIVIMLPEGATGQVAQPMQNAQVVTAPPAPVAPAPAPKAVTPVAESSGS